MILSVTVGNVYNKVKWEKYSTSDGEVTPTSGIQDQDVI